MGRVRARIVAFLIFLANLVEGENPAGCRSGCKGLGPQQHGFRYVEGTTYKYNLDGSVDVTAVAADNQASTTKIKATVLLTQLPECGQLVRLQNVQVFGPDGKKQASLPYVEHPVRIGFHGGIIDDSLCTVATDAPASLNLKRAVVSLFQVANERAHETDVFGVCPTQIRTQRDGAVLVARKTRNLNRCAHRETIAQDFMTAAFDPDSDVRATPMLDGRYASEHRVKNGVLDSVTVTETYDHAPFSGGRGGARVVAVTKMQLIGSVQDAIKDSTTVPRSIIFHNPEPASAHANVDAILAAVKDVKIDDAVGDTSAHAFFDLYKILRASRKDDILTAFRQVKAGAGFKDKERARRVFIDALFRAGSVDVAVELHKNKELDPREQRQFYASLPHVRHVSKEALTMAAALLDQPETPREVYLGLGALVRRHCREHPCEGYEGISQKLLGKIGTGKPKNRAEENEMIAALKAFENMGMLPEVAAVKVVGIAQDKKAPTRLRVASLETLQVGACKDKVREAAMGMLKDVQQSSEIRIKAYLVVAKCPTAKTSNGIKNLLEHEVSHQVGGYIVSHIRNVRASVSPDKALAKQRLGSVRTNKRFPVDLRKYSFNNEYSGAVNSYGVAASVETDVIYTQDDFLPVSGYLNVSTEVFGTTYNFLELGFRQENLHRVLEHYAGPLGVFRVGDLSFGKLKEHVEKRVAKTRGKRDVTKAEIDAVGKHVQMKTHELNKDLDVDFTVKMFGTERMFVSINEANLSPDVLIDQFFDAVDNGIAEMKHLDKTLQTNQVFLDSEFSYPTSLGFALRVSAEGSMSTQAKIVAKIDAHHLETSPLKITLIPSASVEVAGSVVIDAHVFESGLRYASNLYTATGADLAVVPTSDGVDVKFSLPVPDQRLISATHDIVFNTREPGKQSHKQPLKFGQNKDFSVCVDQLSPVLGVTFCADLNSPAGDWPLGGNAKFTLGIQRDDLSHVHFNRVYHNVPEKLGVEYLLETIGADQRKKAGLHVQAYAYPETYARVDLTSPLMPLTVEGRVTNTDQEKSLSLQVNQDKQQYLAKIGFAVTGDVYKPILQYNGLGKVPVTVDGVIKVERTQNGVKYIFDNLRVIGSNQKTIIIRGNAGIDGRACYTDATIADGQNTGSLKTKFELQKDIARVDAELQNTFNPNVNFKMRYALKHQPNLVESDFEATHGPDLTSKTNTIKLFNMGSYKKNSEIATKNRFSYPVIHLKTHLDFEAAPKRIKYNVGLNYADLKVGSELDAKVAQKVKGDYDVRFKMNGFDNKIDVKATREVSGDKSQIVNHVDVNGNKFELDGALTHQLRHDDVNVGADLTFKVPRRADAFKIQEGFVLKPAELDAFLKISSAGNNYVDGFVKSNRKGNANGDLIVTLKDIVNGQGHLQVAKGVGTAQLTVDFVKFHRKVKLDGSFTVSDPKYDLVLTLHPNYEKDSNKLVLSTQNNVKENALESNNYLEISGKKLEVNLKGSKEGQAPNRKQEGEITVVLPTDHVFKARVLHEHRFAVDVENGNVLVELEKRENRNAPAARFTFKGILKDTNREAGIFDVTNTIDVVNESGRDLSVLIAGKRQLEGGKYHVSARAKVSGSAVPDALDCDGTVVYKGLKGTYESIGKYGNNYTATVNGKFDFNDGMSGDIVAEIFNPNFGGKFGADGSARRANDVAQLNGNAYVSLNDGSHAKVSGSGVFGEKNGEMNARVELHGHEPVSTLFKYELADKSAKGYFQVDYERDQKVSAELVVDRPDEQQHRVEFKLDTPKVRETRVELLHKVSPDGRTYGNKLTLTTDGKTFVLDNDLVLSDMSPAVDVSLTYPNGKSDRFAARLNKLTAHHVAGDLQIGVSHNDFVFKTDWDANLDNIDNFVVKANVHSPALKLDRVHFDAQNKGGKRVQITATSAGKNLVTGSTTYKAREEGNKYVVEGSGSFKIREETKQTNFKFVRQTLSAVKHGETGAEVSFNAVIGAQAIDTELKATDKQFRVMHSYCEEKQQCAHVEIDSKTVAATAGEFNNELEVALDLRKLGLSHEFGLKGVTTRKGFVLDHNVDVYFQEKANKYQYSVYVHPNEAGAQLSTPKRVIALEGTLAKNNGVRGEIAFYLDKRNRPEEKTALATAFECQGNDCTGEVKFTNPALGKDLSMRYRSKYDREKLSFEQNGVVDVFADPSRQITVTAGGHASRIGSGGFTTNGRYEIKGQGMNLNVKYEFEIHLDFDQRVARYMEMFTSGTSATGVQIAIDSRRTVFTAKTCGKDLVNYNCNHAIGTDNVVMDADIKIVGVPHLIAHTELTKPASFKATLATKTNPNDKLSVHATYVANQQAEIGADVLQGGGKIALARVAVHLDERNFLKMDSNVEAKNVEQYVVEPFRKHFVGFADELQRVATEAADRCMRDGQVIVEDMRASTPSFKPIQEYYQRELDKLHAEIISDKTLKDVEDFLLSIFGSFIKSAQEIFGRFVETTENVANAVKQQLSRVVEIVNKELMPKFAEFGHGTMSVAADIGRQLVDLFATYAARVATFLDEHRVEIKRVADTCAAILQDVGRALYKVTKHAQIVVAKEWSDFAEGVRKFPLAEEFKTRYEQLLGGLEVPAALINTVKEVFVTLKDAMPTPASKKLVGAIGDYVDKKLRNEKVDDLAALQNIGRLILDVFDVATFTVPAHGIAIDWWPRLAGIKLSSINYLKTERLPTISELLYSISLNPRHWIPPYQLDAIIVQGRHVFTYDGRHLSFPGDCSYLLTRDGHNGNFTVVGTLVKGLLSAITFSDKQHLVTYKQDGTLTLNNAASEFPIHVHNLDVFRDDGSVTFKSRAGIEIACEAELLACHVKVSGFYHGQLRGLLGNGNTEPYDDYTLPNGKIVTSESEFGNAYKVGVCQTTVANVDHRQRDPRCSALFAEDSALRFCFPFVDPESYRIACDNGLADAVADTEKAIIAGYVTRCLSKNVPVHIPAKHVKCKNGPQTNDVAESFSVKIPSKAADVVVVVDLAKSNEVVYKEWVQPLLAQLQADLNAKGIVDVDFHVITYGDADWPSHHTVSGKLAFKGRGPALKFADAAKPRPYDTGCKQLDVVLEAVRDAHHHAQLLTGQAAHQRAFAEALSYPFRSHAVKTVLMVPSKPCDQGLGLQRFRTFFLSTSDVSLHAITPFAAFAAAADPKYTKNVIGFNDRNVFATSDSKKKAEGSAEHHAELDYDDYCVDLALKSRGAVFSVNNFVQATPAGRKQFVQVSAHNIVHQMTDTEFGLDCECKMVSPYSARNVCKISYSKSKV